MAEKGVKSARGELVDFDMMKIKQQMAAAPKAVTVKAREDFIDQKLRRRLVRQTREVLSEIAEINTNPSGEEYIEETSIDEQPIQDGLKLLTEPKNKKEK